MQHKASASLSNGVLDQCAGKGQATVGIENCSSAGHHLDSREGRIGPRLSAVRAKFGLSQRKLSKMRGVSNATIALIEQNRLNPLIS